MEKPPEKDKDLKTVCRELLKLKELGDRSAISRTEYHARKTAIFKKMRELTKE